MRRKPIRTTARPPSRAWPRCSPTGPGNSVASLRGSPPQPERRLDLHRHRRAEPDGRPGRPRRGDDRARRHRTQASGDGAPRLGAHVPRAVRGHERRRHHPRRRDAEVHRLQLRRAPALRLRVEGAAPGLDAGPARAADPARRARHDGCPPLLRPARASRGGRADGMDGPAAGRRGLSRGGQDDGDHARGRAPDHADDDRGRHRAPAKRPARSSSAHVATTS